MQLSENPLSFSHTFSDQIQTHNYSFLQSPLGKGRKLTKLLGLHRISSHNKPSSYPGEVFISISVYFLKSLEWKIMPTIELQQTQKYLEAGYR